MSSQVKHHKCHSRKQSASEILLKTKKDSGQAGMTNKWQNPDLMDSHYSPFTIHYLLFTPVIP